MPNVDKAIISVLVGFIDGDGYINNRIRKSGYIESNLCIEFNNRDFQSKLGFGSIIKTSKTLSQVIIYQFELFYIIVPLLLKYNI